MGTTIYGKHRWKILGPHQHPFKHTASGFAYNNPRIPGVTTLEDALNQIIAAIYPNYKGTVADPGSLPGGAAINDYYIVTDDGDGKTAGYVWSRIDSVEQWVKRYDVDWSFDTILAETLNSTSPVYVHKWGTRDRDESAVFFTGDLAGQRIYGSSDANEHLILYANSGDAAGNTGYVQVGDNFRPLVDSTFSSGTDTYRWLAVYTDDLYSGTCRVRSGLITDSSGTISFDNENLITTGTFGAGVITGATGSQFGNLTLANGSITDSSGAISFDNENLSTTGTLASGTHTIGTLVLAAGSITDTSGSISFGDENLSTTGTLGAGVTTVTQLNADNIRLDGNTISITNLNGGLILSANGTGVVDIQSPMTTLGQTVTGTLGVTGQLNIDNLRLDLNTISSTNVDGNIILDPNGNGLVEFGSAFFPTTNSAWDIGKTGNVWNSLWLDGNIENDTNSFVVSELMALRSANFRDAGRTQPAQAGDALFFDGSQWLASVPDSEVTHGSLSGLTTGDAGHTQFAMLAGRAGGQDLIGGTAASENLTLESTSNATKGFVYTKDNFLPFTNAVYTVSWAGTDLGADGNYFRNIYSKGEYVGLRLENFTFAGLPASSAANVGRLMYATDTNKIYVDTGSAIQLYRGTNKYVSDLAFNGTDTSKDVDVSANITDARNAQVQLLDNTNNFETLNVTIKRTSASNVRIETSPALPAGSYRLIVLE